MPGRPPIPIDVHLARGTYVKSRHSGKLASPAKRLGKPPAWLAGVMPAVWAAHRSGRVTEVIRDLWTKTGLDLSDNPDVVDAPAPAWFANAMVDEWKRLAKLPHIRAAHAAAVEQACVLYGRFVADAVGIRAMTASERATMHSTYMQLGCTPASQGKIPAEGARPADDPWAQFG